MVGPYAHDEGVEAFLPKVSAPPLTEIDHPGVAAVCLANRTAQSVLFARRLMRCTGLGIKQ
jgi:hypothetical protein